MFQNCAAFINHALADIMMPAILLLTLGYPVIVAKVRCYALEQYLIVVQAMVGSLIWSELHDVTAVFQHEIYSEHEHPVLDIRRVSGSEAVDHSEHIATVSRLCADFYGRDVSVNSPRERRRR